VDVKPIRFDLNVNYLHKHSFQPSSSVSHSLEEELTAAEVAIRNKKPGVLVSNATPNILSIGIDGTLHTHQIEEALLEVQEKTNPTPRSQNRKASSSSKGQQRVRIPGYQFSIYPRNIPDPPAISYATNMKDLVTDWSSLDCRATLIINGLRIPLAHWANVY